MKNEHIRLRVHDIGLESRVTNSSQPVDTHPISQDSHNSQLSIVTAGGWDDDDTDRNGMNGSLTLEFGGNRVFRGKEKVCQWCFGFSWEQPLFETSHGRIVDRRWPVQWLCRRVFVNS